jgi:signal transduction histidine kinase
MAAWEDVHSRLDYRPESGLPAAPGDWLPAVAGAVMVALSGFALLRKPAPGIKAAAAAVGAMMSVLATVGYVCLQTRMLTSDFGHAEMLGLVVLASVAVRLCDALHATGAVVAVAAALAAARAVREPPGQDRNDSLFTMLLVLGLAVAVTLCVRLLEVERARYAQTVRQQERLAIARDLHDTLAHQVTGMVVQAQAIRHVAQAAARDPELLAQVLGGIEEAGADALAAMRRLVGALREPDEQTSVPPVRLEEALGHLVEDARRRGLPAGLRVPAGPPVAVPPEIASGLERVAQEALTNVSRYARGARTVEVQLSRPADRIELTVDDDGRGGHGIGRGPFMGSGGFGIMGMRERVEALGGYFEAGPRAWGGWRVRAAIPLPAGHQQTGTAAAAPQGSENKEGMTKMSEPGPRTNR